MKIFTISKRNGKTRTIYAPSAAEKTAMRAQMPKLEAALARIPESASLHGFTRGRSPVTNARQHIDFAYTISFDLSDFFPSVTREKVERVIGADSTHDCLYVDGVAQQGLPSSPVLANIAATPMDRDILALRAGGRFGAAFRYTRYADDMTFSFDRISVGKMLLEKIPEIAKAHSFAVNGSKTHWQSAAGGRRIVTGVAVDAQGVHIPRAVKRRLRAAKHQLDAAKLSGRTLAQLCAKQQELGGERPLCAILRGQFAGLSEWARLKMPKNFVAKSPVATPTAKSQRPARPNIAAPTRQDGAGSPAPSRKFDLENL